MDDELNPVQKIFKIIRKFEQQEFVYDELEQIPVDDADTVLALIEGLNSHEWRVTLACTKALGNSAVGRDMIVPVLIKMLQHKEELVREEAVKSLGKMRTNAEEGVIPILKLMEREKKNLWMIHDAIVALGQIAQKGDIVVPVLLKLITAALTAQSGEEALEKSLTPHGTVQALLGQFVKIMTPPRSLTAPAEEFDDSFNIISAACEALGNFRKHNKEIIPVLIQALDIENYRIITGSSQALTRFTEDTETVVDALIKRIKTLADLHKATGPIHTIPAITDILNHLHEYGRLFPKIVLNLAEIPELPDEPGNAGTPSLKKFLNPTLFNKQDLENLGKFITHENPQVRTQTIKLIGYLGTATSFLQPELLNTLQDTDTRVIGQTIEALGRIGNPNEKIINTLKDIINKNDNNYNLKDLARNTLHQLGVTIPVPDGGIGPESLRITSIPIDIDFSSSLHMDNGLFVGYHNILEYSPPEQWKTNADEFGVISFDPLTLEMKRYPLPLKFPVQPTGGFGARREFSLQAHLPNELLFKIQSPFSDNRGWGNDNFLYSFNVKTLQWHRWRGKSGSREFKKDLLNRNAPQKEKPNNSICPGELILWKDPDGLINTCTDDTPYHLDDWSFTPEVKAALEKQELARISNEAPPYRFNLSILSEYLWVIDRETYENEEEVYRTNPRYRLYDIKRIVLERDKRIPEDTPVELMPCDAVEWERSGLQHLIILLRAYYYNENTNQQESADSLVIVKTRKTGELNIPKIG